MSSALVAFRISRQWDDNVIDMLLQVLYLYKEIVVTGLTTSERIYSWFHTTVSLQAEGAWADRAVDACYTSLLRTSSLLCQTECSPCHLHYIPACDLSFLMYFMLCSWFVSFHHHHIRFWYLWCCGCPGLRGRHYLVEPGGIWTW